MRLLDVVALVWPWLPSHCQTSYLFVFPNVILDLNSRERGERQLYQSITFLQCSGFLGLSFSHQVFLLSFPPPTWALVQRLCNRCIRINRFLTPVPLYWFNLTSLCLALLVSTCSLVLHSIILCLFGTLYVGSLETHQVCVCLSSFKIAPYYKSAFNLIWWSSYAVLVIYLFFMWYMSCFIHHSMPGVVSQYIA